MFKRQRLDAFGSFRDSNSIISGARPIAHLFAARSFGSHASTVLRSEEADIVDTLPISPLLDVRLMKRRSTQKVPKGDPAVAHHSIKDPKNATAPALTPFQVRLQRNPFASILASPVRQCAVTRAMLPRDLMLGWEAVQRPVPEPSGDGRQLQKPGIKSKKGRRRNRDMAVPSGPCRAYSTES